MKKINFSKNKIIQILRNQIYICNNNLLRIIKKITTKIHPKI